METRFWKVILSYDQYYLGRCVILCKRHCSSMSELNDDEVLDFFELVRKFETSLKKSFGTIMFNWCCLMNNAYKTNDDSHVHWHVRPRYRDKVVIEGEEFVDGNFSQHYDNSRNKIIDEKVVLECEEFVDGNFAQHYDSSRNKIISEEIREKIVEMITENFGA